MSYYQRIFLLCLLIISCQEKILLAQYLPQTSTTPVASPTTAGMGQHATFPAVNQNGLPGIQITLATIQENDLSIPIVLSYHGAGVKVSQQASWVGMGWSLMSGGAITRTVRGIPDDQLFSERPATKNGIVNPTGYTKGGWISGYNYANNGTLYDRENYPLMPHGGAPSGLGRKEAMGYSLTTMLNRTTHAVNNEFPSAGSYASDTQPDIFYVNAPGVSCKFIFGNDGQIHLLGSAQDIKITYTHENGDYSKPINSFKITSQGGVVYVFSQKETTRSETSYNLYDKVEFFRGNLVLRDEVTLSDEHTSAWYLSKIITPKGHQLDLHYASWASKQTQSIAVKRSVCKSNGDCSMGDYIHPRTSAIVTTTPVLQYITSHSNYIAFETSARDDLEGGRKLDRLVINSRMPAGGQGYLRSYEFTYHYTTSANIPNFYKSLLNNYDLKRLFLSSIQEVGKNNDRTKQPYYFTYNTAALPHKLSTEQDFWGYYNANGATSLIPRQYIYPSFSGIDKIRNYPIASVYCARATHFELTGSDRSVNAQAIQAGVLQKITYPTGGYSQYIWEPNTYWDALANKNIAAGGLRVKEIRLGDGVVGHEANDLRKIYHYYKQGNKKESSGVLISRPVHARPIGWAVNPDNPVGVGKNIHWYYFDHRSMTAEEWPEQRRWDVFTERSSNSYAPLTDIEGGFISYNYVTMEQQGVGNTMGQTSFEYFSPKNYLSNATLVEATNRLPWYNPATASCSNGRSSGSYTGYGYIQMEGKNIYPFPPMSDDGVYTYGKLKAQREYDISGRLVQETLFEYNQLITKKGAGKTEVVALVHGRQEALDFSANIRDAYYGIECAGSLPHSWALYTYHTDIEAALSKKTVRIFNQNDSENALTNATYYFYGTKHSLPVRTEMYNSKQEKITTETYYAQDYDLTGIGMNEPMAAQIKNLQDLNILMQVESITTQEVNGVAQVVGGSLVKFRNLNVPGEKLYTVPETTYMYSRATLKPRSQFLGSYFEPGQGFKYDSDYKLDKSITYVQTSTTNISEITPDQNVTAAYIWDTHYHFLIAKVLNAKFNEVAYTSFESEAAHGRWAYPETGVVHIKGHTGAKYFHLNTSQTLSTGTLANPHQKYQVSFWAKGQGTIVFEDITTIHINSSDWKYYEYVVNALPASRNIVLKTNGATMPIDEVRLHPVGAQMETYVYDPAQGLTAQTDINNRSVFYEYDALNRLKLIRDFEGNILKVYDYKYAGK